MLSRGLVEREAIEINELHANIGAKVAWHEEQFRVFGLQQPEVLARIRRGERREIEGALAFLEVDPWFYRSGYLKEKVLHALKNAPWEARDEERLQLIVLRALEGRYKREIAFYTRLIPRLRSQPFDAQLRAALGIASCSNHARLVFIALKVRA